MKDSSIGGFRLHDSHQLSLYHGCVQVLKRICWYVVLASTSSEQITLLETTAADKRLEELPLYKELLQTFTTKEVSLLCRTLIPASQSRAMNLGIQFRLHKQPLSNCLVWAVSRGKGLLQTSKNLSQRAVLRQEPFENWSDADMRAFASCCCLLTSPFSWTALEGLKQSHAHVEHFQVRKLNGKHIAMLSPARECLWSSGFCRICQPKSCLCCHAVALASSHSVKALLTLPACGGVKIWTIPFVSEAGNLSR